MEQGTKDPAKSLKLLQSQAGYPKNKEDSRSHKGEQNTTAKISRERAPKTQTGAASSGGLPEEDHVCSCTESISATIYFSSEL